MKNCSPGLKYFQRCSKALRCVAWAVLLSLGNGNQVRKVDLHKRKPDQKLASCISKKVTESYAFFQKKNVNTSESKSLFSSPHSNLPVEGEAPGLCSRTKALDLNQPADQKGSFLTAAIQELLFGLRRKVLGLYQEKSLPLNQFSNGGCPLYIHVAPW